MTFISKKDRNIKLAVDLKTTYVDEKYTGFCNGFTLGSHGEYFIDRKSKKKNGKSLVIKMEVETQLI